MGTLKDKRCPETTPERSRIMSKIHAKDTKIEVFFRKELFHLGYRYRKNVKRFAGTPDLYFRRYNTVIFINGCFWHHHAGCRLATMPKQNSEFWLAKFAANISRDEANIETLRRQGLKVIVIWECLVKSMMKDEIIKKQVISEVLDFMIDTKEDYLVIS